MALEHGAWFRSEPSLDVVVEELRELAASRLVSQLVERAAILALLNVLLKLAPLRGPDLVLHVIAEDRVIPLTVHCFKLRTVSVDSVAAAVLNQPFAVSRRWNPVPSGRWRRGHRPISPAPLKAFSMLRRSEQPTRVRYSM
jgi:hypothetical protein